MAESRWRLTVGRLMGLIALLAVVLAAGLYWRENADVDRALVSTSIRGLAGGDLGARLYAADVLARADLADPGPALAALAGTSLGDPVPAVRAGAVRALATAFLRSIRGRKGPPTPAETSSDAPTVRALIRALGDPIPEVRDAATLAFGGLQPQAGRGKRPEVAPGLLAEAGPALIRLLDDRSPDLGERAARCLADLDPPTIEARDRILDLMAREAARGGTTHFLREALIRGWSSPDLYPALLDRCDRANSPEEKRFYGGLLGAIPAPPPPASIPALLDLMKRGDDYGRAVSQALLQLGPRARPYLGPIAARAARELADPRQGLSTAVVVARIDPAAPEAQALLAPAVRLLRDADTSFVRDRAGDLIALYGASGGPAVPGLRDLLASPAADVRRRAVELLGAIGPGASAAAADLESLRARDPNLDVRATAATTLQIIRAAPDAIHPSPR